MKAVAKLVVLSICLMMAGQVLAQVYGGATVGISDNDAPEANPATSEPGLDGDTGLRAYMGNKLSEKFAVELAFIDLGDYEAGEFQFQGSTVEDIAAIQGVDLSFVGRWPFMRKFALYGRAGVFVWEVERPFVEVRIVNGQPVFELIPDKTVDDIDYSLGLGFEYQFIRHLGFTVEASRYQTLDLANFLYSAGFYLNF